MIKLETLEQRKLIWKTLSEFYLDTELVEEDLLRIANIFQHSSFRLEEIKEIDRTEVFPVLHPNLWTIAGIWTGFNEEWLFTECEKMLHKRHSILHSFLYKVSLWMNRRYWSVINGKISTENR